jgi:DNA-binding HxlR family transcriptional regulator
VRSGAQSLVLLSTPLVPRILRALTDGPKQQSRLRDETGMPAQTTLRVQLKRLERVGAVEKRRRDDFPGALEHELTAPGWELLTVVQALEHWLARAPGGALSPEGDPAKGAIKALADGWSATLLRALAVSPLSLTELDRIIASLSYPSLERRLAALRLSGQIEARTGNGRGTPYVMTRWGREAAGPLAAAMRWEYRHSPPDTAQIGRIDAEALLLLAAPLLKLPESVSGSCRLAIELPGGNGPRLAGVVVGIERGELRSCTSRLEGDPNVWALGSPSAWLDALVGADTERIEPGGDTSLAATLLESLHMALFGPKRPLLDI